MNDANIFYTIILKTRVYKQRNDSAIIAHSLKKVTQRLKRV